MRICAIIVTYNRLNLLKRCISALIKQTKKIDTIIVVNNDSNDGTTQWLNDQLNIVKIHQANLGGSGGFNRGCLYALENKYDFAWLMDDDGFPVETALEHLLDIPKIGLAVANSLVVDENEIKLSFPLWYLGNKLNLVEEIQGLNIDYLVGKINPFNGTLIPIEVMKIIGVPHGDMFIWGDESEYMTRILKNNIQIVTVIKSIFKHPIAKEIPNADWENSIAWKKYYSTRNLYRTFKNKYNKLAFLIYTKAFFNILLDVIRFQKTHKAKKIKMITIAYYHAIANKYGQIPSQINVLKYFVENK